MKLHKSITSERVCDAVESNYTTLANPGFCIECGEDADDCEPDAERYKCHACDAMAVFGAERLLMEVA